MVGIQLPRRPPRVLSMTCFTACVVAWQFEGCISCCRSETFRLRFLRRQSTVSMTSAADQLPIDRPPLAGAHQRATRAVTSSTCQPVADISFTLIHQDAEIYTQKFGISPSVSDIVPITRADVRRGCQSAASPFRVADACTVPGSASQLLCITGGFCSGDLGYLCNSVYGGCDVM